MVYGSALDVRSCVKREGSWTFAQVSVRTYARACGPAQVRVFSATLLIEEGWSQLISLCPPAIPPSG
jgi:hypothetical protein